MSSAITGKIKEPPREGRVRLNRVFKVNDGPSTIVNSLESEKKKPVTE